MSSFEAVFGARRAHADHFLGAQVGADESEAADPGRERAAGLEEVLAGFHVALEGEADSQHEHEVEQHDQPVNASKVQHEQLLRVRGDRAKTLSQAAPQSTKLIYAACPSPVQRKM